MKQAVPSTDPNGAHYEGEDEPTAPTIHDVCGVISYATVREEVVSRRVKVSTPCSEEEEDPTCTAVSPQARKKLWKAHVGRNDIIHGV